MNVYIKGAIAADHGEVIVLFDQSGSIKTYDSKYATKTWLSTFIKANYLKYQISLVGFDEKNHFHFKIDADSGLKIATILKNIEDIQTRGLATDFEKPFSYLMELQKPEQIHLVMIISDGRPDIWDKKLDYLSKMIREDERYSELNTLYSSLKTSTDTPLMIYDKLFPLYYQKNLTFVEEKLKLLRKNLSGRIIIWDISGNSEYLKRWSTKLHANYVSIPIGKTQLEESITVIQKLADEILSEPIVDTLDVPVKIDLSKDAVQAVPKNNIKIPVNNIKEANNNMLQDNFIVYLLVLILLLTILSFIIYIKTRQKSIGSISNKDKSMDEQLIEQLKLNAPESIFKSGSGSFKDVAADNKHFHELTEQIAQIKESLKESEHQRMIFDHEIAHLRDENMVLKDDLTKMKDELAKAISQNESLDDCAVQIDLLKESLSESEQEKRFFENEVITLKTQFNNIQDDYHFIKSENIKIKNELAKKDDDLFKAINQINPQQSTVDLIEQLKDSLRDRETQRLSFEQEIEGIKREFNVVNARNSEKDVYINTLTERISVLKEEIVKNVDDSAIDTLVTEPQQEIINQIDQLRESLRESEEQGIAFELEIEKLKAEFNAIITHDSEKESDINKLTEENMRLIDELAKKEGEIAAVAVIKGTTKDTDEIAQLKVSLIESDAQRISFKQEIESLKAEFNGINNKISEKDKDINNLTLENKTLKDELVKASQLVPAADNSLEVDHLKESLKESEQKYITFEKKMRETISLYQQLEAVRTEYNEKLIEENRHLQNELANTEIIKTPVILTQSQADLTGRVQRLTEMIKDSNTKETKYLDEIDNLTYDNLSLRKQVESAIGTVHLALSRIEQLKAEKAV